MKNQLDVINSLTPVVEERTSPVIVVGLPRSGSTYLAHVLSCLDDWFVFDDLYPLQKAASLGIDASLNLAGNEELIREYVNLLTWQLRAKIKFESSGFYVPNLSWEDTFHMESCILQALGNHKTLFWFDVLEEWMTRLSFHCGKSRWGYKTPQDFMHLDELVEIFPGVRFIYILRDPRKVFQSYKSLPRVKRDGSQDGVSRQYHPVIYSLYWKQAYETIQSFIERGHAPVEIVKFENLVTAPEATADRLARFLDTTVASDNVSATQSNSSLRQGTKRDLTNTEIIICEAIAGSCMEKAGYNTFQPNPRISDIWDLLDTSFTFVIYQVEKILKGKGGSIFTFVKRLLADRTHTLR
jgi:hypothetical protein